MEISLINVNFHYKCVNSTLLSEFLLGLMGLRSNQLKIIPVPNRGVLGWFILPPFSSIKELLDN